MSTKFRLSSNQLCLLIVLAFCVTVFSLNSCRESAQPNTAEQDMAEGKVLAAKYCVSCHQLPDPALIDRESWVNGVLPAMARNLHIQNYMGQYFSDKQSVLNIVDWQKIVSYYTKTSPVALAIPKPQVAPVKDWAIFSLEKPKMSPKTQLMAMTTLLAFNPYDNKFYSGDAANNFYRWDKNLNSTLIRTMPSPVTGAIFSKGKHNSNEAVITCIGILPPVELAKGKVVQLNLDGDTKHQKLTTIGDSIPRAVQSV